jgi:hypothetical protein
MPIEIVPEKVQVQPIFSLLLIIPFRYSYLIRLIYDLLGIRGK